ncbi:MBL fold metallo-hydrolase [Chloroflexota bacterium]
MEVIKKQISDHIHSIRIPFKIPLSQDRFLERFVCTYLIYDDKIWLVDSGVSGSKDIIFNYIRETGRDPSEIAALVLTHAHPDHVGGALGVQTETECMIAAHGEEVQWIEDVALQNRERPVPGFQSLVEGSVNVNRILSDGDIIELGTGSNLEVIHTPGHSKGHVALFYKNDAVMITGDCVPVRGDMPVYDDVASSLISIGKLLERDNLAVLLSSWDEPRYDSQAYNSLQEGIDYIRKIHRQVIRQKTNLASSDVRAVATMVCKELGFPDTTLNPLFFRTIEAHLSAPNI